jgi:hypothetical protein
VQKVVRVHADEWERGECRPNLIDLRLEAEGGDFYAAHDERPRTSSPRYRVMTPIPDRVHCAQVLPDPSKRFILLCGRIWQPPQRMTSASGNDFKLLPTRRDPARETAHPN